MAVCNNIGVVVGTDGTVLYGRSAVYIRRCTQSAAV